jgi:hypothetical protein
MPFALPTNPGGQISNLIYRGVKVRGRVACNNRNIVTEVMDLQVL